MPPQFNRERFLLRLVAWILAVQFGIFIIAGFACSYGYYVKTRFVQTTADELIACPHAIEQIRAAAGESLAVLLALLGGSALAASEIQRRSQAIDRDNPKEPPDQP
jgi:hypothetical protein